MPIRRARCGSCQAKSADNTGCCKAERHQWRKQRTEAGAAVAECEGLLPPKHDAGTATRHYRAFWQRRCRAAAAGAVLKPQGGNCAVLPLHRPACRALSNPPTSNSVARLNFHHHKKHMPAHSAPGICFFCYRTIGNTAQFPPCGLSTAPAAAARHLRCQNAR